MTHFELMAYHASEHADGQFEPAAPEFQNGLHPLFEGQARRRSRLLKRSDGLFAFAQQGLCDRVRRDIFADHEHENPTGLVMDRPRSFIDPQPDSVFPDLLYFPLKQGVGAGGTLPQLGQYGLLVARVKQFHDRLTDEVFFQIPQLIGSKAVDGQHRAVCRESEIHEWVLFVQRLVTLFTRLEGGFSSLPPFDFPLEVPDGLLEPGGAFPDLCFEGVPKVLGRAHSEESRRDSR